MTYPHDIPSFHRGGLSEKTHVRAEFLVTGVGWGLYMSPNLGILRRLHLGHICWRSNMPKFVGWCETFGHVPSPMLPICVTTLGSWMLGLLDTWKPLGGFSPMGKMTTGVVISNQSKQFFEDHLWIFPYISHTSNIFPILNLYIHPTFVKTTSRWAVLKP